MLAFHRKVKFRLSIAWRIVWSFLLRWGAVSRRWIRSSGQSDVEHEDEGLDFSPKRRKRKGVHWAVEDENAPLSTSSLIRTIIRSPFIFIRDLPRWAIWLAALLFFRSQFFRIRARATVTLIKQYGERRLQQWREKARRLEVG